ncbi:MAG: hypothetical protein WCK51_10010 [Armatimonadota bacterium]
MVFRPEQGYERGAGWSFVVVGVLVLAISIGAGLERQFLVCIGGMGMAAACFAIAWYALAKLEYWNEMEFAEGRLLLRRNGIEKVVSLSDIDGLGDSPDGEGGKTLFLSYGNGRRIGFEACHEGRVFLSLIAKAQGIAIDRVK